MAMAVAIIHSLCSSASLFSSSGSSHLITAHSLSANHFVPSFRPANAHASASKSSANDSVREFALKDFVSRRALKVITGLQNFDEEKVASVVIAADKGGATHVHIACSTQLVNLALQLTNLPVCVSSVKPKALVDAVDAGAHMVEIGNYDSFYQSNRVFSAEEVKLAECLEKEGADIIQTEGGTSSKPLNPGVHGLIEKATPTLAAAYSISRAVKIPVMCASGLSDVTAPLAFAAGAAGVGVGSAVNKLNNQVATMIVAVRSIADSLGHSSVKALSKV